jgi:effector-binding domain-containing protein
VTELDVVRGPLLEERPTQPTLGIGETVPFRTMLSNRDRLLQELIDWLAEHQVEPAGPFFLRLHVVDMAGLMQIEVGVVATSTAADERVRAGTFPVGRYAVLAYRAKSMAANRRLRSWVESEGIELDSAAGPEGEAFAGRFETYLTDPRVEPRKTRWIVELAFKTRPRP